MAIKKEKPVKKQKNQFTATVKVIDGLLYLYPNPKGKKDDINIIYKFIEDSYTRKFEEGKRSLLETMIKNIEKLATPPGPIRTPYIKQ